MTIIGPRPSSLIRTIMWPIYFADQIIFLLMMLPIYTAVFSLVSHMHTARGFGAVIGACFGSFIGAWVTFSASSSGRMQITNARVGAKSQIIRICESAGINVLSGIGEQTTILLPDRSTFRKKLKYWGHIRITITDDGDNNLFIEGPLYFLRKTKRQLLYPHMKAHPFITLLW